MDELKDIIAELHIRIKNMRPDFGYSRRGISTGFKKLDEITGGFSQPEFTVLAARPSGGKTSLAISMLRHIALEEKIASGFLSLEMPNEMIGLRLLSQEAMIPFIKLRKEEPLARSELARLDEAMKNLSDVPVYLYDKPYISFMEIRDIIRYMIQTKAVKIVFIDYLGLIAGNRSTLPRHEQMAEITSALKNMSRELAISIVALAQTGGDSNDLIDSDVKCLLEVLSKEADTLMLLQQDCGENDSERQLIVTKQQNSSSGKINLRFLKDFGLFEN